MTDSDNGKLDEIIDLLKRQNRGLAAMAEQIQNLAATIREKMSPAPPLEPPKRR
jgi:hypothetical protein